MAATEVDSPPVVSTKRLEGSLVAPPTPLLVPNHLTAIKTFFAGGSSGVLQTKPSVLHFSGYRVGHTHKQTLRVINASKDNQHMHIIPPSTPHFSIHYTKKKGRLVPGLSLDITVQFRPTEWKYYYDCIRIHCKDDQNLLVPIHAYPVMNTAKFPSNVRFPTTPVGRTRNKTLTLECDVPVDFEFQLAVLQHHPAFVITPMRGVVPANGKVDVMVTFAPTEFSTAIMKVKLELTQFNSSPLVCTFSGSSLPGLDIDSVSVCSKSTPPAKLTKTVALPPLSHLQPGPGSKRKKSGEKTGAKTKKKELSTKSSTGEDPIRIDCPAVVSRLLTQKPSHQLLVSDSHPEALSSPGGGSDRHEREGKFLKRVGQIAKEERANKLRWVTQLGSESPTPSEMEAVLQERSRATQLYLHHYCHEPVTGSEFTHTHTQCFYRRTCRLVNEHPPVSPKFDQYSNNVWQKRQRTRLAFVRAARKVLIQVRVQRRLEKIRKLVHRLKNGTEAEELLHSQDKPEGLLVPVPLPVCNFLPLSFPKSTTHTATQSSSKSSVQITFPVKPTEVSVQRNIPLMELKVPNQYQLLGYTTMLPPLFGTYIPPGLPRPLRTGAEAERENLGHLSGVDPAFLRSSSLTTIAPSHPLASHQQPPLTVQDIETDPERRDAVTEGCGNTTILPLVPPQIKTEAYSVDIFNPCPGVVHYVPPLPHSEVTLDHTFLPLPLCPPSSAHSHPPLHPQDYIPGLMHWKPFPSLWLVANEKRDVSQPLHSQRTSVETRMQPHNANNFTLRCDRN
ncbi:Cilia- and flagella-associated protein 221 [Geodia barretti]|uniref:Cilia- and flagella-associated protein 221 n=1 Tax=Geodia barretti TaxID=519541 RepID=A0AA35R2G9_GEOBA|nr:Cilia- and flagella-associated protein 221 [Geodia barretti]